MEYLIGVVLALGVCGYGTIANIDHDRSFYPVMLIVVASYYDLFAVLGGGMALGVETGVFALFLLASFVGMRTNLWIVVVALAGHGVLDFYHDGMIANAGVPVWWPMFCMSFDVVAAAYLAWRLVERRIKAEAHQGTTGRMRPHVDAELDTANKAEAAGDHASAFRHLERAHVLGQSSTVHHLRVHVRMLFWGMRRHDPKEVIGQVVRIIGAATKTWIGLLPKGNTGGANVSAFKPMPIADDLAELMTSARVAVAGVEHKKWSSEPNCETGRLAS